MPLEAVLTLVFGLLNVGFAILVYVLNSKLEGIKATAEAEAELREKLEERLRVVESRRDTDVDSIFTAIKNVGEGIASFREQHLREMHQMGTEIRAEIARLNLLITSTYVTKDDCFRRHDK